MVERQFATKFRGELREQLEFRKAPYHLVTLYDAPRSGKKVYDSYVQFLSPSDCPCCSGTFVAIEFKSTKAQSVSASLPTERQLNALKEVVAAGGKGYIITHLQHTKQVLVVDVEIWDDLFGNYKSLKITHLKDCENEFLFLIDREKCLKVGGKMATRWNLNNWLNHVS